MADACLITDWMEPDMAFTTREKDPLCFAVLDNIAMKLLFFKWQFIYLEARKQQR